MAQQNTLGVDFGTSNSAAGIAVDGKPVLIPLETGQTTLPTAVFFDPDTAEMSVGRAATQALVNGDDGRFMRALKSLLGTSLMREKRRIYGRETDFIEITAGFLRHLKTCAQDATGKNFEHALSGRPVKFHSRDVNRNSQAEIDLRDCYHAAGFKSVHFMFEPEAALRASPVIPGLGLIVDIGGGTSDFTVFERSETAAPRVLGSDGVRVGGTDFDRLLSLAHIMPLLGRGSGIKSTFGTEILPAPNRIFNDLATWQMIPFLYTPETRRAAADFARHAVEPDKLRRLVGVLRDELGHDLAFAAEDAKIRANQSDIVSVNLAVMEPGLRAALSKSSMEAALAPPLHEIAVTAQEALNSTGVAPNQIRNLVMVGGASMMGAVQSKLRSLCPNATLTCENAMTAVADGLALASAD